MMQSKSSLLIISSGSAYPLHSLPSAPPPCLLAVIWPTPALKFLGQISETAGKQTRSLRNMLDSLRALPSSPYPTIPHLTFLPLSAPSCPKAVLLVTTSPAPTLAVELFLKKFLLLKELSFVSVLFI